MQYKKARKCAQQKIDKNGRKTEIIVASWLLCFELTLIADGIRSMLKSEAFALVKLKRPLLVK